MGKQRRKAVAAQRKYGHIQERRAEVLAWVKREEKAGRERRRQGSRGQGRRM